MQFCQLCSVNRLFLIRDAKLKIYEENNIRRIQDLLQYFFQDNNAENHVSISTILGKSIAKKLPRFQIMST
jgi:hypothetical protein